MDYSDIFLTIEDFGTMEDFLQRVWYGDFDDKVLRIKGRNSTRISNCAVMISDGSNLRLGVSWEVEGGTYPDDYPADDTQVELTGVLRVANEYGARVLFVPSENIKIL